MTDNTLRRLLLGPQRPAEYLSSALDAAEIEAESFAVISAGWQEAENDIDMIRHAIGRPMVDLCLYGRAEALFSEVPEMGAAYRERQDRLQELQRLYRLRLRQLSIAARGTLRESPHPDLLEAEHRHAITQLRALDRHHLAATERLHEAIEADWQHARNRPWRRQYEAIRGELGNHDAVIITGGNLPVLLNRMRLFRLEPLLASKTLVGWSAGAMVLAERIALYHDHMPHGRRDPELLGTGSSLISRYVVLPDPRHRLQQDRRRRLGLLARRMSPYRCLVLDHGEYACFDGDGVLSVSQAREINREGRLVRITAP